MQGNSLSPSTMFTVVVSPSKELALSNCLAIHPYTIPADWKHVMVNGKFPLTTKRDDTGILTTKQVGISGIHRLWMNLKKGDKVAVTNLPAPIPCMDSLDLEITSFDGQTPILDIEFSAGKMAETFVVEFQNQVFCLAELLSFKFSGRDMRATVKGLNVSGGGGSEGTASSMGLLMDSTKVTVIEAANGFVKIRSNPQKATSKPSLGQNIRLEDMEIGGLDTQVKEIFRRAFASRQLSPDDIAKLGIQHVKGIILFGPPGTGKTLMAREIAKALKTTQRPKIVNGPEILDKFVGSSEQKIRDLFVDAEEEYRIEGENSGLHVIIFDELDAIFRQRGSDEGSGGRVGDSIVNQLLSKMDGVDSLNNILIIGMTNRLDMIDEALQRPGRFEVKIQVPLPDESGRHNIFEIHTSKMKKHGRMAPDVDLRELAKITNNFSGAEISGLVRDATSFALPMNNLETSSDTSYNTEKKICVTMEHFRKAHKGIQPAFGVSEGALKQLRGNRIIPFDEGIDTLLRDGSLFVNQVRTSTPLFSILLHGPSGSGKTTLAAKIAGDSDFPFIKLISSDNMVGFSESQQVDAINKVFVDSQKSSLSVIVLDDMERLLRYVPLGDRFSNPVLQALLVLLRRQPPDGHRLLIIATTTIRSKLNELGMSEAFKTDLFASPISTPRALEVVLDEQKLFSDKTLLDTAMRKLTQDVFGYDHGKEHRGGDFQIGIKKLLDVIQMVKQEPKHTTEKLIAALVKHKWH